MWFIFGILMVIIGVTVIHIVRNEFNLTKTWEAWAALIAGITGAVMAFWGTFNGAPLV